MSCACKVLAIVPSLSWFCSMFYSCYPKADQRAYASWWPNQWWSEESLTSVFHLSLVITIHFNHLCHSSNSIAFLMLVASFQKYRLHMRRVASNGTSQQVNLWASQEQFGESLKQSSAQFGSPEGPLHLSRCPEGESETLEDESNSCS